MIARILILVIVFTFDLQANISTGMVGSAPVRDNDANNKLSNIESKTGTGNQDRKLQLNELKEIKDSFNNNYVDFNSLNSNQSFKTKVPENNLPNIIKDRNQNVIENIIRNNFKNKKIKLSKRNPQKERQEKIKDEQNLQLLILSNEIVNNHKHSKREFDQIISEGSMLKSPKESMDFNNKLLLVLISEIRQNNLLKAMEIRNNVTDNYKGISEFSVISKDVKNSEESIFPKPKNDDWNIKFN
jgi:hypothetical protein